MMLQSLPRSSRRYGVSELIVSLLCLYIIFFSVWPFFIDVRITEKIGINPERVVLALVVVISILLYFGGGINSSRLSVIHKNKVVFYSVTAFFLWRFLSVVFVGGLESLPYWIYEVLSNYAVFIIALLFVDNHADRKKVLGWLTASLFIVLLISIIEFFNGGFLYSPFVTGDSRAALGALSGSFRNGFYRVQGSFEHALVLSQYLLILLPIVLFYINHYLRAKASSRLILSSSAVALTLLVLLMAQCRTSLVTLFAWTVFCIYRKVKRGWQRLFLMLFVIISAIALYNGFVAESGFVNSDARYAQLVNGFYAVLKSPIIGYGPGVVMGEVLYDVGLKESGAMYIYKENSTTVDSRYLSIILESGVLSLIFFSVFLMKLFLSVGLNDENFSSDKATPFYYSLSLLAGMVTMLTLSIYTIMPILFLVSAISLSNATFPSIGRK